MTQPSDADSMACREAADWFSKLDRTPISAKDLRDFSLWRSKAANQAAWNALQDGRKARTRYVVRSEVQRFKVVDIWTGETAVIAMTPQDGLSEEDALHTAGLLNRRSTVGDRSVLQ